MGYGFDWAWSGLGLVLMGLGWAELKILEPIPNTVDKELPLPSIMLALTLPCCDKASAVPFLLISALSLPIRAGPEHDVSMHGILYRAVSVLGLLRRPVVER